MSVRSSLARFTRGLLLVAGISVFALGLLVAFVPGAEESLPMEALIAVLGSDYLVVAVLGLVSILFALLAALFRRLTGIEEVTTPVVERVQSASAPGASIDRSNSRFFGIWIPESARNRLREAAIQSLMRSERCPRAAAERRVEEGAWTDDTVVARLLEGADPDGAFGGAFGPRSRVRRTVEAIDAIDSDGGRGTVSPGHNGDGVQRNNRQNRDTTDTHGPDSDDRRTESGHGTATVRGD